MTHVVVDPVTRIEGHLRIEAEVDGGAVKDAWSSSHDVPRHRADPRGRDPRDAWVFAQRICGVCTTVHAIASIRAVENAIGAKPPPNARLLRNLIMAAQIVQDHVDPFLPSARARLGRHRQRARRRSRQDLDAGPVDLGLAAVEREVLCRGARSRQGVRRARPARHLRQRLLGSSGLPAAARGQPRWRWRTTWRRSTGSGASSRSTPFSAARIRTCRASWSAAWRRRSIPTRRPRSTWTRSRAGQARRRGRGLRHARLPARRARDRVLLQGLGVDRRGRRQLHVLWRISRGRQRRSSAVSCRPGIIHGQDLTKIEPVDQAKISTNTSRIPGTTTRSATTRGCTHSRARPAALHRAQAAVSELGSRPEVQLAQVAALRRRPDGGGAAGADARCLCLRTPRSREGAGRQDSVDSSDVGPAALFSTLGRIAARAIETQVLVESMDKWVEALADSMARRDYRIQDNFKVGPSSWPSDCFGAGFHEAPRGSLGHWVHIKQRHRSPTTSAWCRAPGTPDRATPRDSPGPYEAALVGTPVAKPEQPLEILRTVHSFDPCMACGVHVVDATRRELARVRVIVSAVAESRPSHVGPRAGLRLGAAGAARRTGCSSSRSCVLAATGYYIGHPFISVPGAAKEHFVMGTVRSRAPLCCDRVHAGGAGAHLLVVRRQSLCALVRAYPGVAASACEVSGRRLCTIPLSGDPVDYAGHNGLAGGSYAMIFAIYLVMIATGFALYTVDVSLGSPM